MFVFRTQIWSVNRAIANEPCTGCIVSLTSQEIAGENFPPTLASCSATNALLYKVQNSSCSLALLFIIVLASLEKNKLSGGAWGVERWVGVGM